MLYISLTANCIHTFLCARLVQDFGKQIQGVFKDYSRTRTIHGSLNQQTFVGVSCLVF